MDNPGEIMRFCRLCLVKDQVNIPIFEEQGDIRQIFLKISSCLPVKVSREDKLPKKICDGCSNKLDLLYEFWNTSANAEKTLLSWLGQAGVKDVDQTITAVAQQIAKPSEPQVKEETPEDGHAAVQNTDHLGISNSAVLDDSSAKDETEEPPPKRARRTAAVKAQINLTPDSEEEDDDLDTAEPMTKIEDESDESDNDDKDPSYVDVPGTSADDQPGPSGVGKDGAEAPMRSKEPEIQIKRLKPNELKEAMGKYVVAEFLPFQEIVDVTIEAIPGYWLGESATPFIISLGNKIIYTHIFAYTPIHESSHQVRKAKLKNILPDTEKWIKWPIRFVLETVFDNYQDARREEANAEAYPYYSDLEVFKADTRAGRRRLVSKKKHWPDDTDISLNGDDDVEIRRAKRNHPSVNVTSKMDINLLDPPENKNDVDLLACDLSRDLHDESSYLSMMNCIQPESDCTLSVKVEECIASPSNSPSSDSKVMEEASLDLQGAVGLNEPAHIQDIDLIHLLDRKPLDDFYKACFLRLLHRTANMENKVAVVEKRLECLSTEQKEPVKDETVDKERKEMETLVPLPVSTVEGLKLLNDTLRTNSRYFTFLRLFMKDSCPIPNLKDFDPKTIRQELHKVINHIYSHIMTNELATQYNMFGRRNNPNGPPKEGFVQFKELLTVTFEAIKPKAELAKLDLIKSQCDGAVGEWLRQAVNRMEVKKVLKKKKMAEKRAAVSRADDV
ncbi:uncharacterized protein LOC115879891 isoform X5 [Sitophilus oryzae]|uniref:Uncharacterized protein LOC115879891 isoform X5 n=1 Tax=Sitophilus oryzae TaxID=7048 RepID=A0A6J2XN50_SITOR|nr:uncharacterized protein LOC115879891 isoform X5 [Sitophilus oryzae]